MKKFGTTINGYDKTEVNRFVDDVTHEYESMLNKLKHKDREISLLKEQLEHYHGLESALNKTILVAEDSSNQIKKIAKDEAKLIIEEAKKTSTIEANEIIDNARKQIIAEEEASHRLIEKERVEMEEGIKKEIIDVAFMMSEKILGREINKDDHKQIVDDAMSILDEEGKK